MCRERQVGARSNLVAESLFLHVSEMNSIASGFLDAAIRCMTIRPKAAVGAHPGFQNRRRSPCGALFAKSRDFGRIFGPESRQALL